MISVDGSRAEVLVFLEYGRMYEVEAFASVCDMKLKSDRTKFNLSTEEYQCKCSTILVVFMHDSYGNQDPALNSALKFELPWIGATQCHLINTIF